MEITKESVSFGNEECFDYLFSNHYRLWVEVVDALADHAQDCYSSKYSSEESEDDDAYLENGIDFQDGLILFLK